MSLRKKQSEFVKAVGLLIHFAYGLGFELTFGDAWARDGHMENSKHYRRLAIDLNLFDGAGNYLTETKDHEVLGLFWESIGGIWGGRFKNPDGNHYEYPD